MNQNDSGTMSSFQSVFMALNCVALLGWITILFHLFPNDSGPSTVHATRNTLISLETICFIEVLRIALGDLPGNLVLGVVLHMIRLTVIFIVLPSEALLGNQWIIEGVLGSWAVTEVARYPMYIFRGSIIARNVRLVIPLLTFPVGAFSEGLAAWKVLQANENEIWTRAILIIVLFVNGVLGSFLAYPALLRKGLPILGMGKKTK
jgi:hypothetical protein